jgi:hypothetical protein
MSSKDLKPLPNLPNDASLDQWAEEAIKLGHNETVVRIVKLIGEGQVPIGEGLTAAAAVYHQQPEIE